MTTQNPVRPPRDRTDGGVPRRRRREPDPTPRTKMYKWGTFTVGMVVASVLADVMTTLIGGGDFTLTGMFGKGELLLVSVGLLVAAAGELLFDRLLVGHSHAYQAVLLSFCFIMSVPVAVAYGAAKNAVVDGTPRSLVDSPAEATANRPGATVLSADGAARRTAVASLPVFAIALALSSASVAASDRSRHP